MGVKAGREGKIWNESKSSAIGLLWRGMLKEIGRLHKP